MDVHVHVPVCAECATVCVYVHVHVGTWQNRDESANLLQKYDVELIKDAKRYCTLK